MQPISRALAPEPPLTVTAPSKWKLNEFQLATSFLFFNEYKFRIPRYTRYEYSTVRTGIQKRDQRGKKKGGSVDQVQIQYMIPHTVQYYTSTGQYSTLLCSRNPFHRMLIIIPPRFTPNAFHPIVNYTSTKNQPIIHTAPQMKAKTLFGQNITIQPVCRQK